MVPLLVEEPTTPAVRALLDDDPAMVIWWTTEIACVSAVARLEVVSLDDRLIDAAPRESFPVAELA